MIIKSLLIDSLVGPRFIFRLQLFGYAWFLSPRLTNISLLKKVQVEVYHLKLIPNFLDYNSIFTQLILDKWTYTNTSLLKKVQVEVYHFTLIPNFLDYNYIFTQIILDKRTYINRCYGKLGEILQIVWSFILLLLLSTRSELLRGNFRCFVNTYLSI